MRSRRTTIGALFATTTAVAWGGQFVVGKSALGSINAFPLSTIRYALAVAIWLAVLAAVEGRSSLRLDGRGLRLFWLGSLGFAGFNLLAYTGLAHARPQSASLIVALAPLLTALVVWRRTRVRPSNTTFLMLNEGKLIFDGSLHNLVHCEDPFVKEILIEREFAFRVQGSHFRAGSCPARRPINHASPG